MYGTKCWSTTKSTGRSWHTHTYNEDVYASLVDEYIKKSADKPIRELIGVASIDVKYLKFV